LNLVQKKKCSGGIEVRFNSNLFLKVCQPLRNGGAGIHAYIMTSNP
jgi:hypothetical protein